MARFNVVFGWCLMFAAAAAGGPTSKGQGQNMDEYGGVLGIQGKPTGAFHLEKIERRDCLVDPAGHGFLSLGVVHVGAIAEKSPNDVFRTKYQKDWTKVSEKAAADLRSWGFNTAGYHSPRPIRDLMPFMADSYSTKNSNFLPSQAFSYPDVFDPAVQETAREAIRRMCGDSKDNPRLIGYYWTDTPQWDLRRARKTRGIDWVSAIRSLDAAASGKRRYTEFLLKRHRADAAEAAKKYRADLKSADEIAAADFSKIDFNDPLIRDDDCEFLRLIARELYRTIGEETRRCDPNHLVFGERYLMNDHPDEVVQEALPYIDALAIQPLGPGFNAALFDRLHSLSGKPILLCDHQSSFPTPEYDKTMWQQLESEETAGVAYENFLRAAFAKPYILGYHRCQYIDRFVPYMRVLKQGLLREDETPYATMVQHTRLANEEAMKRFANRELFPQSSPGSQKPIDKAPQ